MATPNNQVQTGNLIYVEFNDQRIGMIQSVRASDDYGLEAVTEIGDIHVQEYAPTRASHSLSVSNMVLLVNSMRASGIIPVNGDAALLGLTFDIVFYSALTNARLRKYTGCSYASGDVDVSANRIVVQSGQFRALDVSGTGL